MTSPEREGPAPGAAKDTQDDLELEIETLADLDVPEREAEELHGGKAPIGFTTRDDAGGEFC